jgi:hypothetical protein
MNLTSCDGKYESIFHLLFTTHHIHKSQIVPEMNITSSEALLTAVPIHLVLHEYNSHSFEYILLLCMDTIAASLGRSSNIYQSLEN